MCWDLEFPGAPSSTTESQLSFWSDQAGRGSSWEQLCVLGLNTNPPRLESGSGRSLLSSLTG